jgi:hypothetical protein
MWRGPRGRRVTSRSRRVGIINGSLSLQNAKIGSTASSLSSLLSPASNGPVAEKGTSLGVSLCENSSSPPSRLQVLPHEPQVLVHLRVFVPGPHASVCQGLGRGARLVSVGCRKSREGRQTGLRSRAARASIEIFEGPQDLARRLGGSCWADRRVAAALLLVATDRRSRAY